MRVGLKPKASGFIKNGRGLCMEHTHEKAEAGGKPRKPRLASSHQKLEERKRSFPGTFREGTALPRHKSTERIST